MHAEDDTPNPPKPVWTVPAFEEFDVDPLTRFGSSGPSSDGTSADS